MARKHLLLPIGKTPDGTLKIVVGHWNMAVMDAAQKVGAANRLRIAPALATESHLRSAIEHYYEAPTPPPLPGLARRDRSRPPPHRRARRAVTPSPSSSRRGAAAIF